MRMVWGTTKHKHEAIWNLFFDDPNLDRSLQDTARAAKQRTRLQIALHWFAGELRNRRAHFEM